jgi:hypothetical protein
MEQDYLKKQIDQIGQIMGKLLSQLLELKTKGTVNQGIEIVNQTLKSELNFDVDELIAMNTNDLLNFLVKEKKLNNGNIEQLADILLLIAEDASKDKKRDLYERCLIMYQYLDQNDNTFSLDRNQKIEQLCEIKKYL